MSDSCSMPKTIHQRVAAKVVQIANTAFGQARSIRSLSAAGSLRRAHSCVSHFRRGMEKHVHIFGTIIRADNTSSLFYLKVGRSEVDEMNTPPGAVVIFRRNE